jgi:anti-sigma-K factor RskA
MPDERACAEAFVIALGEAAEALDRARRIEPDPGLDHAVERLRLMIGQWAARLDALIDEAAESAAPAERDTRADERPQRA